MTDDFNDRKTRASAWFRSLRDDIVAAFEGLEQTQAAGPFAAEPAGEFEVTETKRSSDDGSDAGGGLMSVMRGGRVVEKARKKLWRRVVSRAWIKTRGFGRRASASWRICRTRKRQRFI